MYKNQEGYNAPNACVAVGEVTREERQREAKEKNAAVTSLITMLKQIISLAGVKLVGRIVLRG